MVSLNDIARHTGFSYSTVAFVLGGKARALKIKEETRNKILQAAQELGYYRNEIASQMSSGKSKLLAMMIPSPNGQYFTEGVLQALVCVSARGYSLQPFIFTEGNFQDILAQAVSMRPAGFLTVTDLREPNWEKLLSLCKGNGIPCGAIDFVAKEADFSVLCDEERGIREMVAHLVALGHREIAHFTAPLAAQFALRRLDLYRKAFAENGIALEKSLVLSGSLHRDRERLEQEVDVLMARTDRPTAITCSSDSGALWLMTHLLARGVKIPEEVSLTGFSDSEFSTFTEPQVTTIRQPMDTLAETAVSMMFDLLDGKKVEPLRFVPTELVKRGSSSTAKKIQRKEPFK